MGKKFRQLLFGLFGILVMISGCQKNPDEDVVTNKNEGTFERIVGEKNTDSGSKKESIPETYKESFKTDAGDVSFEVDAKVHPVDGTFPVVRTEPHEIQPEEVKKWADALFEGETAYEPATELSKSEIEEKILMFRRRIADKDALTENFGGEKDIQAVIDYYNGEIRLYEELYKTAPDKVERKKCDWVFHPYEYYDSMIQSQTDDESLKDLQQLYATATVNGHKALIDVANRDADDYSLNNFAFYYEDEAVSGVFPAKKITAAEAEKLGGEVVKSLGLKDWKLWGTTDVSENEESSRFVLLYTPLISGVPMVPGVGMDVKSEDLYAANYDYSQLEIRVYDGSVREIWLTSPMDTVEVLNENVKTMKFGDVCEKFRTQMQTQYSVNTFIEDFDQIEELKDAEVQIKVSNVYQGMFRVKEKNSKDSFLAVPVWSFEGSVLIDGEDWGTSNLCIVNAVDGSIIDPALGY